MKFPLYRSIFAFAFAAASIATWAVPARQGVRVVKASDGSEIRVRLVGDEFFHQYLTDDDYPLLQRQGRFYYCSVASDGTISDSGIEATAVRTPEAETFLAGIDKSVLSERLKMREAASPRRKARLEKARKEMAKKSAVADADQNVADAPPFPKGYGLFPTASFPAYGKQKAIVILVEYSDVKFNLSDAGDYFTRMLGEDGFADYGATGCASEYFRESSDGAFQPEFDVYGPVTLSHPRSYYGENNWYGDDMRPEEMVIEACKILDPTVDFSQYDRNNDGVIDNIFLFYAGQGEASYGPEDSIWPHSWNVTEVSENYFDGVLLDTYGCTNEWERSRPDGVGTFVHEFSHVLGLPDLYATSYSSAFTPGSWSALDYGPYNNDGMTPPAYSVFERYALGWIEPRVVDCAASARLLPISENYAAMIPTTKDTEFFLLETRKQTGWDAYIPGHGMLVWHVDYDPEIWMANVVNDTKSHQYVDIEEADGTQKENSRAGDAFPGTSSVKSFTSTTSPAMKTWSGKSINFPITNIAEQEDAVIFDILGGYDGKTIPTVVVLPPSDLGRDNFAANWEVNPGYTHYLSVFSQDSDGNRRYLPGYHRRNVGSEGTCIVEGADPETEYYYTLQLAKGLTDGPESAAQPVITDEPGLDMFAVEALEASEVKENSFTANWLPLEGAVSYFLEVSEYVEPAKLSENSVGDPDADIYNWQPLEGYEHFDVGDVTSYTIEGLKPSTTYAYFIRGFDGDELMSQPSNRIQITTTVSSGVKPAVLPQTPFIVEGRRVHSLLPLRISASDAAGCEVAAGIGSISLPAPGIYMVSAPGVAPVKIIIN